MSNDTELKPFVVVPREPTDVMSYAGGDAIRRYVASTTMRPSKEFLRHGWAKKIYAEMLAAAPSTTGHIVVPVIPVDHEQEKETHAGRAATHRRRGQ